MRYYVFFRKIASISKSELKILELTSDKDKIFDCFQNKINSLIFDRKIENLISLNYPDKDYCLKNISGSFFEGDLIIYYYIYTFDSSEDPKNWFNRNDKPKKDLILKEFPQFKKEHKTYIGVLC
jgi:hypothetical protein